MASTTIWLRKSTKERLDALGGKGETYDAIINRLLTEKTIPVNLLGRRLYRQGVYGLPIYLNIPYTSAFIMLGEKNAITFYQEGKNYGYWDINTTTKKAWILLKKELRTGTWIGNQKNRWEKLVQQQMRIEKTIGSLEKLSDNKLNELITAYSCAIKACWDVCFLIELFDPGPDEIIEQLLNLYDTTHLSVKEFKTLCTPALQTSLQKEMVSLYSCALGKGNLHEHQSRFYWIKNCWSETQVLHENYFKEKIERLREEGIDFKRELSSMNNQLQKLIEEKKRIQKKRSLSFEIKQSVSLFSELTIWREERKKCSMITNHFVSLLMREVGRRSKIDETLLSYATLLELQLPLSGTFKAQLSNRKKISLFYAKDKELQCMTGSEILDYLDSLKRDNLDGGGKLYGSVANPGKVEGTATVVFSPVDLGKMKKGDIMVAPCTRPDVVPAMKLAKAILTDEGGVTSHASIMSRELGVPCIVGLKNATDVIKDGDKLYVNANHGVVSIVSKD